MKNLALFISTLIIISACSQAPKTKPPITTLPKEAPTDSLPISQEPEANYKLYLIALEDKGLNGKEIGCEDSVVGVESKKPQTLISTEQKLTAAYNELLSLGKEDSESGFSNFLTGGTLKLDTVKIDAQGKATIKFSGKVPLAGVCDHPRIENQLTETALQFTDINNVDIFINNQSLKDFLSLK
jgi:hypothetical protein